MAWYHSKSARRRDLFAEVDWRKYYYAALQRRMKKTGIVWPRMEECKRFVDLNLTIPENEKLLTPVLLARRLEEQEKGELLHDDPFARCEVITWKEFYELARVTFGERPDGLTKKRHGWGTQLAALLGVARRRLSGWESRNRVPIVAALRVVGLTTKFKPTVYDLTSRPAPRFEKKKKPEEPANVEPA